MAQERYTRQSDFSQQVSGSRLNEEFAAVSVALGHQADALGDVRRDDGELKDRIVKRHTMHQEVEDWVGDIARQSSADPVVLRAAVDAVVAAKLQELGVLAGMLDGSAIDFLSFEIVDNNLVAHYKGVLNPDDIFINAQGMLEVSLNG